MTTHPKYLRYPYILSCKKIIYTGSVREIRRSFCYNMNKLALFYKYNFILFQIFVSQNQNNKQIHIANASGYAISVECKLRRFSYSRCKSSYKVLFLCKQDFLLYLILFKNNRFLCVYIDKLHTKYMNIFKDIDKRILRCPKFISCDSFQRVCGTLWMTLKTSDMQELLELV